ncbi:MAG: hypothetical protein LH465_07355 [Sphingomonas bacterium]|nr:hypothetical protein [Sphingomonas bacterium]
MSHSVRFIGFALVGWVGLRAVSLGLVPGAEAFAFDRRSGLDRQTTPIAPAVPPLVATEFAPIDPVSAPIAEAGPGVNPAAYPLYPYSPYPFAYAQQARARSRGAATPLVAASLPAPRRGPLIDAGYGWSLEPAARYADATVPIDQWPLAQIANGQSAPRRIPGQSTALTRPAVDRLSMSAWAMLRREPGGPSLAANGMLGGSQAGARILWRFDRRFAASLRTSAPIGGVARGGEVAAGVRWQPFARLPLALTAERRQTFGQGAGSSGFALFAEGGVYERPIIAGFNLDAYFQAGVVGIRRHDLFVDGSATLMRPMWRQLSVGMGVWGGMQPGLSRVDVGPRLTWRVGRSMRIHADYRQRLAGSAAPGSGPVLTLAGDF